jgi:hypothetical protein
MSKRARWWGRDDWERLDSMSREELRDEIIMRLKTDLGYKSAKAYSIFKSGSSGAIIYFMIYATDHPEGPIQMARACRNTVRPDEPFEDTQMDLFLTPKEPDSELHQPATLGRSYG